MSTTSLRIALSIAVLVVQGACGSGPAIGTPDAFIGPDVAADHPATPDAVFHPVDATSPPDVVVSQDRPQPPPPPTRTLIYAHTDTTLYSVDVTQTPFALTSLGDFDCVGGTGQDPAITDLAVDKNGNLTAVSQKYLYALTIDGSGVHCPTPVALQGTGRFYGLTYAPQGVLGTSEVLVAANSAGELWAIDAQGQQVQVGTLGTVPADDGQGNRYKSANVGNAWELSGDIVFLYNNGDPLGFATVRDCPNPPDPSNCNTVDTLIELDLSQLQMGNTGSVIRSVRGQIRPADSCAGAAFGSFYGIAAYEDKVYGFSRKGDVVDIDNSNGTGCLLQSDATMKWSGAATTTLAPVVRPQG